MRKNSPRRDQVVKTIKNRLLRNIYKPGERLPSFNALEKELAVARGTLRQAIRRLAEDGFINTVDRSGIYAVKPQPFNSRFALLFRHSPRNDHWNCFYDTLLAELNHFTHPAGIKVEVFFDVAPDLNNQGYTDVMAQLAGNRLGGVIFTEELFPYVEKCFLAINPDLRHVYIFGKPEKGQTPSVDVDNRQLWQSAISWLRHRGCQRIGVIDKLSGIDFFLRHQSLIAPDIAPHRVVVAPEGQPAMLKNLTLLLLSNSPDGLFIGNDNFLPGVVDAVAGYGQTPGKDIVLISHCNRPGHTVKDDGVTRIGFDTRAILDGCIDAVSKPRIITPPHNLIPALFNTLNNCTTI